MLHPDQGLAPPERTDSYRRARANSNASQLSTVEPRALPVTRGAGPGARAHTGSDGDLHVGTFGRPTLVGVGPPGHGLPVTMGMPVTKGMPVTTGEGAGTAHVITAATPPSSDGTVFCPPGTDSTC